MKNERYSTSTGEDSEIFRFTSVGVNGKIQKIVQYSKTNYEGVYILAFGDKNNDSEDFDDLVVSNNGDGEKVLSTVVATLYAFFAEHPGAYVYLTGSTNSRTRLYQIGINKYLIDLMVDFDIYGEIETVWEDFEPGKNYDAFLVKQKNM